MSRDISVVIPTRQEEDVAGALASIEAQTIASRCEVCVVVDKEQRGAPWARNRGASQTSAPYVLFCDDDIEWEPDAFEQMLNALQWQEGQEQRAPRADGWRTAYTYGGYVLYDVMGQGRVVGNEAWHWPTLQGRNFVSTMSLLRRDFYPTGGWDESLKRLQDWDLWLRVGIEHRGRGLWVGRPLFRTRARQGITFLGAATYEEAWATVRRKHGLPA